MKHLCVDDSLLCFILLFIFFILFVFERKKWKMNETIKIKPKINNNQLNFHFIFIQFISFSTHKIIHFIIFWNHNLVILIDEIIFIFSHRLMIFSSNFIHNYQSINFLFIIFVVMKIYLFMFHCVNFDSFNDKIIDEFLLTTRMNINFFILIANISLTFSIYFS